MKGSLGFSVNGKRENTSFSLPPFFPKLLRKGRVGGERQKNEHSEKFKRSETDDVIEPQRKEKGTIMDGVF